MSDPPRLSRHLKGGLAAKLIDSARDDDPPRSARQRAVLAIGTGGGALFAASAAKGAALSAGAAGAAAASAAAGGSTAPAGTTTGAVFAWGALAKWVGGGAVAALVTAGAMTKLEAPSPLVHRSSAAIASHHGSSPATPRKSPHAESQPAETPPIAAPPTVVLQAPPVELERPRAVASKMAAREVSADSANEAPARRAAPAANLVGEIAALDHAREALAGGAADSALAALDDYDRRFPAGTLAIEAQVLRIESLAQKGERDKAARLADAFLAQHPSSAHAARMRSLLVFIRKDRAP